MPRKQAQTSTKRGRTPTLAHPGSFEHYEDADLYEHEYKRRREDVRFYAALAAGELPPGAKILELCCGSGRVTRQLLRAGFRVYGIDMSEPMLERARLGIGRLPKRFRDGAELHQGDMRNFSIGRRFPLILAAFNSLEHLYTAQDIHRCLTRVHEHLDEDGLFAFDVQMPDLAWLQKDPEKKWARTKFRHPITKQWLAYSTNHVYDHVTQVAQVRLYYEPLEEGPLKRMKTVRLRQRKFFPAELRALVEHAGFLVTRCYGDFSGFPLDQYAESQVLLCRKAGKSA